MSNPEFGPQGPENTTESWREWHRRVVSEIGKEVRTVPVEEGDWVVKRNESGEVESIEREDGLFFRVVGKEVVGSHNQPFIEQAVDTEDPLRRHGIVVMFFDRESGDVLLNAVSEIGANTPGAVTIRPTIQHSHSNIQRHNFPFSELFGDTDEFVQFEEKLIQLGGVSRNLLVDPGRVSSVNLVGVLPVDKNDIGLSDKPYHRWFTEQETEEMISEGLLTYHFLATNSLRQSWQNNNRTV
jgi:hypothetical protein